MGRMANLGACNYEIADVQASLNATGLSRTQLLAQMALALIPGGDELDGIEDISLAPSSRPGPYPGVPGGEPGECAAGH